MHGSTIEKITKLSHIQKLLVSGIVAICVSLAVYVLCGYNTPFLIVWLLGLAILGIYFWKGSAKVNELPLLQKSDLLILAIITIVAALIYLPFPYSFPYQINTDEIVIRDVIVDTVTKQAQLNPLGPSNYFGFPVFIHLLFGWLATAIGGITFTHLRTIHALFGTACVVVSYIFFRALELDRRSALVATTILGFNHSLIAISRMVSRNNTSLLIEMIALAALFRGLIKQSPFLMYIGGMACGAGFYTYSSARTTIFTFLLSFLLSRWSARSWKQCFRTLLPALVGFCLTTVPMAWAAYKAPSGYLQYQFDQFLIFPQARELERQQVWAHSELEGVLTNIRHGLLAFNCPISDNSNIYLNDGFGFLDNLTGIMIWVGLAALLFGWKKRAAHRDGDILCASAFISLWLVFSLLITFAPSYTRLLIMLPFVAYLAGHGIVVVAGGTSQICRKCFPAIERPIRRLTFFFLVLAIALGNYFILVTFFQRAIKEGHRDGGTFRAVVRVVNQPQWSVVLACDKKYPYYDWCGPTEWKEWMDGNELHDRFIVVKPAELEEMLTGKFGKKDRHFNPPFSLFLNKELFEKIQCPMHNVFPNFRVNYILPDGKLLYIEVVKP